MNPYDLSSYFADNAKADDVLFVHVASRRLQLTALISKNGTPPDNDVFCRLVHNDTNLLGYGITYRANGSVDVDFPAPLDIEVGDSLRVVSNSDGGYDPDDEDSNPLSHVLITFEGEEITEDNRDDRYDLGSYTPGRIKFNQHLMMALVPRTCQIKGGLVHMGKNSLVGPIPCEITLDGEIVGTLAFTDKGGKIVFHDTPFDVQPGQVLRISTPEREKSGYIDQQLSDVSVSIFGRL